MKTFSSDHNFPRQKNSIPCNFWMAEDILADSPGHLHAYVMIRSPKSHVLSQYFHCTESTDHKYARHLMPALDDWLDTHVKKVHTMKNMSMDIGRDHGPGELFKCYDPINMQSHYTDFDDSVYESDLRSRFGVIGIMDQFGKSVCALSIRYTGLVPPSCNCTRKTNRRLNNDHGVTHHGSTFNVTDSQLRKISQITELDTLLYSQAKLAFAQQVLDIEDDFDIVLCNNPRMDD